MKAMLLEDPAPVTDAPLKEAEVPVPEPAAGQIRLRVTHCGVCRTDLHIVEGDLAPRKTPVIPGHQVVGSVEAVGPDVRRYHPGRSGADSAGLKMSGAEAPVRTEVEIFPCGMPIEPCSA